jgi:hypothetical protein
LDDKRNVGASQFRSLWAGDAGGEQLRCGDCMSERRKSKRPQELARFLGYGTGSNSQPLAQKGSGRRLKFWFNF